MISSAADILQIVSVVCRVVFLLFLAVVRLFHLCKTFEIFRYFCTPKTTTTSTPRLLCNNAMMTPYNAPKINMDLKI